MHRTTPPFPKAWLQRTRSSSAVLQPRAAPFLLGMSERGCWQCQGNQTDLATQPAELGSDLDLQIGFPAWPWSCLHLPYPLIGTLGWTWPPSPCLGTPAPLSIAQPTGMWYHQTDSSPKSMGNGKNWWQKHLIRALWGKKGYTDIQQVINDNTQKSIYLQQICKSILVAEF